MNDVLESPELQTIAAANPVPRPLHGSHLQPGAQQLLTDLLATPRAAREIRRVAPKARRRVVVTVTTVVLVGVVGGAAAAAGLIPAGVSRAFRSLGSSGNGVTDARMVAETTTSSGIRVQIWTGHNSNGGVCEYDRTVAPDGHGEDGSVSCFATPNGTASGPQPADPFTGGLEPAGKPLPLLAYEVTAITTMPAVTRIALVYDSGETIPLSFNRATGYAVAVVPARLDPESSNLNAYDINGKVIATIAQRPTGCATFGCTHG
jgi:hypothetical protein